jgi:hypothetical protein
MPIGGTRAWPLAALAALAVSAGHARPPADDARGAWMLALGVQVEEGDADSELASLDFGIAKRTWLTLAAARSSSPADRADITADALVLGVDHRFAAVGFALEAERWGDSGVLETQDFSGSVYVDRDRWRLGLGYETRDIDIPVSLTGPLGNTLRRTVSVSSDSVAVDARVSFGPATRLYLSLAEHDYERNLHVLPRIERLNLLSTSTLTLANAFLDRERSLAVERDFRATTLNVRFATDRSAVDDSELDTLEAAVLFPVGARVELEINVGRGRSDFFDAGSFGGLTLLVYGS